MSSAAARSLADSHGRPLAPPSSACSPTSPLLASPSCRPTRFGWAPRASATSGRASPRQRWSHCAAAGAQLGRCRAPRGRRATRFHSSSLCAAWLRFAGPEPSPRLGRPPCASSWWAYTVRSPSAPAAPAPLLSAAVAMLGRSSGRAPWGQRAPRTATEEVDIIILRFRRRSALGLRRRPSCVGHRCSGDRQRRPCIFLGACAAARALHEERLRARVSMGMHMVVFADGAGAAVLASSSRSSRCSVF
mmetsp:Transcript_101480/g.327123  ORF Transcript_101480/g.327123 Transcript_101480/m.327123 type:complete len:247 (+) Transcript_101480:1173-1913(+)